MKPREAHALLIDSGAELERTSSKTHRIYRWPGQPGFITIPWHGLSRDLPLRAEKGIRLAAKNRSAPHRKA